MVRSRIFTPLVGVTQVSSFAIYGVRMLGVARTGDVLDRGSFPTPPGNHQYTYGVSTIYLDPADPIKPGETIWAIFET